MNRRLVIVAGSACILLGLGIGLARPDAIFGRILRRHLPGVRLSGTSAQDFTRDYWPSFQRRHRTWRRLFAQLADEMLPGERSTTTRVEREIVTAFLMGSNFFRLSDPTMELVEFHGLEPACANPFRRA